MRHGGYAGGIVGANDNSNILISNCYNKAEVTAIASAAGILGYSSGASKITINGSYNKGTVTSTSNTVGGILGYAEATKIGINNCYNEGTMITTSTSPIGGIIGTIKSGETIITSSYNLATITNDGIIGGIVGSSADITTINDCYNNGEITSQYSTAGGIIADASNNLTINRCYNSNKIKIGYYYSSSAGCAGGVVASCNGTTTSITDCYNTGYIDGSQGSRGGIIGSNSSINITLTRCYNAGQVATNGKNDTKAQCIVGNIGSASDSNFTNTFYIDFNDNLIANSFAKKKTETEMKTDEFLEELKGSTNNTAWKRDPKKNNGMPILSWQ